MTTKVGLLPFVNRNLNLVADHNGCGLFAYGSRGCIFVLDFQTSLPSMVDSKVIRNAHRGKLLSLSFCKSNSSQLLASVGEEMILKIWDLETTTCIASLEVKECSQVVEWLYETTNLVVFPEPNGSVCKWNFNTNNLVRIKSGSDRTIHVLSSSQKCPELLAVGHSVGTISILNVNNHTYVKSLKAHSKEIHSLSWSPVSPSLLLSTSLDQSARIWNLDEDKPVHTYYYPSSRNKDKFDDKKNFKACSIFHPENPDVIICSNVRGAFGSVQFRENLPPKFTPYSLEDEDHNFRNVFRMVPYVDVTGDNKHVLLTCDPVKVTLWNVSDQKLLSSHYYVQGNIFDLSSSPIDHNLLAVGAGDGFLKVLNMRSEEKLMVTSVYINLRMKIMSIAWHPSEENIIAYGSDEGRVGIVDFYKKKNLYSFETHHTNSVYTLQWGPCSKIKDSKQTNFLYSCGGGNIFIHELGKPKEKAVAFETISNVPADVEIDHKSYSELRWQSDYTCLALGTFHGSVYLYNDKFDFLCQLSLQLKNVENLRWHPKHTYSSHSKESKYSSWLAAAGNNDNIHIFDASEVTNRPPEASICKPTKTLVGHKKKVSALCWSSHTDGHLISGGRDGLVQVWNAITATPIVNYMWHRDAVYAVQWSISDPDIVYSGGMDNCLRIWKISEQNQSEIPAKLLVARHKSYKHKYKPSPEEKTALEVPDSSMNETSESKTSIKETSDVSESHFSSENVKHKAKQLKSKVEFQKEKDAKVGFFRLKMYSKEESFQNVFKLVDILCDESVSDAQNSKQLTDKMTPEELLNLGLFTDQFTALKMLEAKGKMEMAFGNKERAACIQIMACNVTELLTEAAEKRELTDFLVSISPSVSYKFWLNMCEKYAVQLIEEQQFMKGSIYFMLCGKLYDALRILSERGNVIEALAIAKARLPESDPCIKSMLHKVCTLFSLNKHVENEAACHIALKDPLHAAKIMFCAGDSKYAYASVYICSKFNLLEAAHEYAVMSVEKCLSQNDWPTFYKVAEMVESVKIYKVVVRVHEIISSHIKMLKKEEGIVGNNIFGVTGTKILIWSGKILENSNVSFLTHIYDVLKSEGLLPEDEKVLQDIHQALISMESTKSELPTEAHINVAIYISQVIITSLLGDPSSATKYFIKIFSCTYNVVFIPKVICWIFFPLDVYWCSNTNTFICEVKKMDTELLPSSSHFQDIFNSVCNKFGHIGDSDTQVPTSISPDMTSSLDLTVQQVLTFLSGKKTEESLLLYFSTHYLSGLRRLAKKGWRFRCYDNGAVSDVTPGGIAYMYDTKNGRWLVNSDATVVEESVSKEDVLKLVMQSEFKLAGEYGTRDASLDVPSIIDVVSHVFSSETDSNKKDELVQHYGFKDVSDFLQKVMSGAKAGENQHSSCSGNMNSQINEGIISLLRLEDEDLHAQCWTDVGLYYVLTKSLFSVICRDEYALLYYLQKYLLSLDMKIADLARLQSMSNSNHKSGASKVVLHSNRKEKTKDVKESKKIVDKSENDISSSLAEDIKSSVPVKDENSVIDETKVDSTDTAVKLEGEDNLVNENFSKGNPDNCLVGLDPEHEYTVDVSNKYKSDSADVILLNGNTNLEYATKTDATVLNGSATESESNDVVALSDDAMILINKNTDEEINLENAVNVQNKKDGSLKTKEENSVLDVHISVTPEETKDCNSDVSFTETEKTEHENDSLVQDRLQIQRERISHHIKLLQLEEFWYPDPFVSVTDIKAICCDIFYKHPCTLIKQKFHELAHEVEEWCTKFCLTDKSKFCEICKKISA